MEYEQFKKVLVRIAALTASENSAGALNEKLEKATANKKKTAKKSMVANDSMQKEDEVLANVDP